MTLIEEWDQVLKKAWSVKFNMIAAVFGGLEVAVQLVEPSMIHGGVLAGIGALISVISIGSRVLAQKELTNAPDK